MSDNASGTITRRKVIRATGGGLAVGLGATGAASAHCQPCDECVPCSSTDPCDTHHRFCGSECVVTVEETGAYDVCPFDAFSHVTTIESGRAGFIADVCENGCEQGLKVDFDCTDTWWVEADAVCQGDLSDCTC